MKLWPSLPIWKLSSKNRVTLDSIQDGVSNWITFAALSQIHSAIGFHAVDDAAIGLIIELGSFIWAEVIRFFFSCAIISFNVLNVLCYLLFHCPVLCRIQFRQLGVPWSYVRQLTHVHMIFINIGFDYISISEISISAVRINISVKYLNSYKICLLSIMPIVMVLLVPCR